jgi:hypothetical protein
MGPLDTDPDRAAPRPRPGSEPDHAPGRGLRDPAGNEAAAELRPWPITETARMDAWPAQTAPAPASAMQSMLFSLGPWPLRAGAGAPER